MKKTGIKMLLLAAGLCGALAQAQVVASRVADDLTKPDPKAKFWAKVAAAEVMLMAQPMVVPRPAVTTTSKVTVQAVHDGKRVAFRLSWSDPQRSEAGKLGEFSDGAAIQFPAGAPAVPPMVMMGSKDNPVHIFHWRAQYQRDAEKGKPTIRDLYPNVSTDMYPMEFVDPASSGAATERDRERYSPGRAEGNPQSYSKSGVDEIIAEGFSTSSVQAGSQSFGNAVWDAGQWALVISRPLVIEGGSSLTPGKDSFIAFAVWQGGAQEVGSRKSVTMAWTNLQVAAR